MDRNRKSNVKVLSLKHEKSLLWNGWLLLAALALISAGLASCSASPAAVTGAQIELADEISVDKAYELYEDGVFFLDVRTPEEWDEFHAPNTTLIPLDELESRLGELPEGEPIVVVCRSGNRSQTGRDILQAGGFEDTTSMAGGLRGWMAAGYPVE